MELEKNAAEHPGEVQSPRPDELLVVHGPDRVHGAVEPDKPLAQRARVVQTEVLDVDDGEVERFEDRHHLAQAGGVATGEDSLLEPRVDRSGTVASDTVHERETIGA